MTNLGKFITGPEFMGLAIEAVTRALAKAEANDLPKAYLPMPENNNVENDDFKSPNT